MRETKGHNDPRIPERSVCVTRYLIDRWASEKPSQDYIFFEDGEHWTYAELKNRVVAAAVGLQRLGVSQGDHVGVWLPNGREALVTFFAVNYVGAVFVPFNTAYRGNQLEHVLENSDANVLIAHGGLVERLEPIDAAKIDTLVLVGEGVAPRRFRQTHFGAMTGNESDLAPLLRPIEPWDTQSIMYTSGTTGPSKGVISSYLHLYCTAGPDSWPFIRDDDRFLINMPMFHTGGTANTFVTLARGGSVAMMENFSTEGYWDFARRTECTVMFLLGAMATFLMKAPPSDRDRDHKIRLALMAPYTEIALPLHERFGIDIYTIFNMTEINSPIVSGPNPAKAGTCGQARAGVEVRLVDGNDCEVAIGMAGEMVLRSERPWEMNTGYYKNHSATAQAWRNGWFHTGDVFKRDENGYYYYVDRLKDAIRRRGENISSFEVESQICAHPDIREAAVIGVASEYSEEEVMAVIATVPGRSIDLAALTDFLAERLSYFMVPRYFRVVEEVPKTSSAKVMKAELRKVGVTPDTWDRERAGIRVKRERL